LTLVKGPEVEVVYTSVNRGPQMKKMVGGALAETYAQQIGSIRRPLVGMAVEGTTKFRQRSLRQPMQVFVFKELK